MSCNAGVCNSNDSFILYAFDVLQGEGGKHITLGHLLNSVVVIRRAIEPNLKERKSIILQSASFCDFGRARKAVWYFFQEIDTALSSAIHPIFKCNWLDETNPIEKDILDKIAVTLKERLISLREAENETQPNAISRGPNTPDDHKDFFLC